ncbi:unnamed protein product [Fraxinus pennsylvanica]|uniref:Uncharacterized protein n=1 Tax=Fraxinus pennsylvanica TaxID=56036 RepID=A0AAD2DHN7_9LAMI|nr:unnamed protein product [Fraxinus pennsylvanica]
MLLPSENNPLVQIIINERLSANLSPASFDAVGLANACINKTGHHAWKPVCKHCLLLQILNPEAITVAEQERTFFVMPSSSSRILVSIYRILIFNWSSWLTIWAPVREDGLFSVSSNPSWVGSVCLGWVVDKWALIFLYGLRE